MTQAGLASTICKTGYTATIRPSSYVTAKEKKANALSYGYTSAMGDAEYDHQLSGVATSGAVVWAVQSVGGTEPADG